MSCRSVLLETETETETEIIIITKKKREKRWITCVIMPSGS